MIIHVDYKLENTMLITSDSPILSCSNIVVIMLLICIICFGQSIIYSLTIVGYKIIPLI